MVILTAFCNVVVILQRHFLFVNWPDFILEERDENNKYSKYWSKYI